MLEFAVRLFAAGLLFLVSSWIGTPDPAVAWKISAAIAAYACLGYWLETSDRSNPGIKGALATADSGAIAFIAASAHALDQTACWAILPVLYTHRRTHANIWYMATVAAGLVLAAHATFKGTDPTPALYVDLAGIFVIAALAKRDGAVTLPVPSVVQEVRNVEVDSNAFLVLRENFRKLKDHCQDLERKTKRERLVSQLFETRLPGGDRFHAKLAKKLQELTGIQSLALYTFSQFESTMVVRATSGDSNAVIEDNSFNIDPSQATRQITDNIELTMRSMLEDSERSKVATILLQSESSVVGMINLFHADWDNLYEAKRLCEEVAGVIALLISEENTRRTSEARIAELELLYEVVAVTSGAVSRKEIVERVVERLHHFVDADFIGGYFIEHGQAVLSGFSGREMRILDQLSFANGPGLEGWLATGAPEVAVFRTSDDDRCDGRELLRRRIGSFLLIPLQYGEVPFGFVIAASRVSNGLDRQHLHTLRAVIAECSQAISRLEQPTTGSRGLVSVTAFQMLASAGRQGCIVIMELLKKQDLMENCGESAVDTAMRAFSLRINAKLPPGGAACQRKHGDFIVYLPGAPEDFARSWANDLAATASMIGVPTLGGRRSMPMAFRSRVALVGQQSSEVLSAQAS